MCCTSVFYFMDHLGYQYLEKITPFEFVADQQTALIAKCQRLSVLGHASLVSGMIFLIPKRSSVRFQLSKSINRDTFLIYLSIGSYLIGYFIRSFGAIAQFSVGLLNMAIITGAFLMVKGFLQKKIRLLIFGGSLFLTNFIASSLSGYKEHIFVNFLIIGCLIYPFYRKIALFIGIPVLYGLFYILPTYVGVIRSQAWVGEASAEQAQSQAIETLFNEENTASIDETNWGFLTRRLSEIEMFTKFAEKTPEKIPYYGFDIVFQSVEALIPRVFWPAKPITEAVAMERVYNAGIISRMSIASAKTRPVVDAYLSGGTFGVFISLFIYGLITQGICNKAEALFGGYQLGCLIVFNGLFQPIWRGNNFEFIANSIFYNYVLMLIIFQFLKANATLVRVNKGQETINQKLL